jgi:hypothetical protein
MYRTLRARRGMAGPQKQSGDTCPGVPGYPLVVDIDEVNLRAAERVGVLPDTEASSVELTASSSLDWVRPSTAIRFCV